MGKVVVGLVEPQKMYNFATTKRLQWPQKVAKCIGNRQGFAIRL